jgi:hypothetical protein
MNQWEAQGAASHWDNPNPYYFFDLVQTLLRRHSHLRRGAPMSIALQCLLYSYLLVCDYASNNADCNSGQCIEHNFIIRYLGF